MRVPPMSLRSHTPPAFIQRATHVASRYFALQQIRSTDIPRHTRRPEEGNP